MPVTARDPGRARLVVTLAGAALALLGGVLWLIGDENKVTGANRVQLNGSAAWGEVLGFESDQAAAYEAAREQVDTGETQMGAGVVLVVVGLAAVGSRRLIRPAAEQ
ncbi:hypothetical protein [Streptomyces sp. UH6]|uniref:hypothetical protein n=1 Tax=Streptomyces sp. UH6 TaxID=2748379 RepID=UPI0015D46FEE|nr:hypothetical protein [Streptomyces sp. UH6]NYV76580.1 hypothetical protein [Streptomyces sp. UH6]